MKLLVDGSRLTMGVISLGLFLIALYLYLKWYFSYWIRRGLDCIEPDLFFGNAREYVVRKLSLGDQFTALYNQLKAKGAKHGGVFIMFQPTYLPIDLDIIKGILLENFSYFENRGVYVNEEIDPLTGHLFALEGEKWKKLRSKMTPAFTSGKLKIMFSTIVSCTESLKSYLSDYSQRKEGVDIKEVASGYTIDVIGNVGFGINVNSLKNANCVFRQFGRDYFQGHNTFTVFKIFMSLIFPKKILNIMRIKITSKTIEDFFMGVINDTVNLREQTNGYRKDIMHLLLQLKNRGRITTDRSIFGENEEKGTDIITLNELAAQCFVFFLAGYETSASTMTFALLEMALNPDIQNKVREEINTVLQEYDGEITYDALQKMDYFEKVLQETFRKYCPGVGAMRICTKPYTVPNTNVTLEVGTRVMIPFKAIMWDPEHFPDPEKFDPERFSEENKSNRHPLAFMPFGAGQRKCIGWRLGLLQLKAGLAVTIQKFNITLNEKTQIPIKFSTASITPVAEEDVWLNFDEL